MPEKNQLDDNVERIRQEYRNDASARKLAKKHGVTEQSIYNATSNRTYKNRGGPITKRKTPMTDAEKDEIRNRCADGQNVQTIAAQMGRSYQSVLYWVQKFESEAQTDE